MPDMKATRITAKGPARDAGAPVRQPPRRAAGPASAILDLQRLAGNQATRQMLGVDHPSADRALRAGGAPLAGDVRAELEGRFGESLADVRLHDGPAAAEAADAVSAHAFTFGAHMVFGRGRFDAVTSAGRALLAHEVAHVIQQRRGGASPAPHAGGGLERAADRAAGAFVASGGAIRVEGASAPALARQEKPAAPQGPSQEPLGIIRQPLANVFTYTVEGVLVFSVMVPDGVGGVQFGAIRDGMQLKIGLFGDPRTRLINDIEQAKAELAAKGFIPLVHDLRGVKAGGAPKPDQKTPAKPAAKPATKPPKRKVPSATVKPEPAPAPEPKTEVEAEPAPQNAPPTLPDLPGSTGAAPEPAPTEPVPHPGTEELIAAHTHYFLLDEAALGQGLLAQAQQGNTAYVQDVLDKLDTWNRDDVALAFAQAAKEEDLDRLASSPGGRRLLDRLFDELTSGEVSEEEQAQATRILGVKTRAILTDEQFAAGIEHARKTIVLPYRKPGLTVLTPSPVYAARRPNGDIWVKLRTDIYGTDYVRDPDLRLPPAIWQGIELKETDVVGVKLYDNEGQIIYVPALYLLQLENEATRVALHKMGEAAALGLTFGTLGLGGRAAVAVGELGTGARVLYYGGRVAAALDHLALAVDVANSILQEHRSWIIAQTGESGRRFIADMEALNSYMQIYGLARGAQGLAKLALALRGSFGKWRGTARALEAAMSDADRATMRSVEGSTQKVLEEADGLATPVPGEAKVSASSAPAAPVEAPVHPVAPAPVRAQRPAQLKGLPSMQEKASAPRGKLRAVRTDEPIATRTPPSSEPQQAAVPQALEVEEAAVAQQPVGKVSGAPNAEYNVRPQAVKANKGPGAGQGKPATVVPIQPQAGAPRVKAPGTAGRPGGVQEPVAPVTKGGQSTKATGAAAPHPGTIGDIRSSLRTSPLNSAQRRYMESLLRQIEDHDLPISADWIDALKATDNAGRWKILRSLDKSIETRIFVAAETRSGDFFPDTGDLEFSHRVENARMALNEGAERVGTLHGRDFAETELELREAGWTNAFEFDRSRFGTGFDDVMLGPDGETWIVEYKGGSATLSEDQKNFGEWINSRIEKYKERGGPIGADWAKRLEIARDNGKLRGVVLSTPIVDRTPQPTIVIKMWPDPPVKAIP